MTRNGKIARLPQAVREQLNERLADGQPGNQLADWLNSLPEVNKLLAKEFAGEPVNEVNLTRWKQGGFLDWSLQQEARDLVRGLADDGDELLAGAPEPVSDRVGVWLAARYAVIARKLARDGDQMDARRFRELCSDVVALRRSDHAAQRLKQGWQRLELEKERTGMTRERLYDEWSKDPQALEDIRSSILSTEEMARRMQAIMDIK